MLQMYMQGLRFSDWNIDVFAGVCPRGDKILRRGAMASDRLAELLRSASELTEEEISLMSENDAWELIHTGSLKPEKTEERAQGGQLHQMGRHPDRD